MSLPYRTLAAGVILCGTTLSCSALPVASGASGFGAHALIPIEWRSPDEKAAGDIASSAREPSGYSRYRFSRHHRHHRHHRRGRHRHRFFFF